VHRPLAEAIGRRRLIQYTSSTVEQIFVKKQAEEDANLIENEFV